MRDETTPSLFCAWCGRELGWGGGPAGYTLCADCVPLVRAHYESTRTAYREFRESPQARRPASHA